MNNVDIETIIDQRNIIYGYPIPKESYCDQPYVVITDEGSWLCVLTTGTGHEGDSGQHIVSTISTDQGKTWSPLVDIEPSTGPEASWVTPLRTPDGRIYVFYTYNKDNLRSVVAAGGISISRVDSIGCFMLKYSDDHGRTWSEQRYEVPIREMDIDRENPYGGKVRFFWSVSKPLIHQNTVYIGLSKVGRFGKGFFERSEGVFMKSDNLLRARDPADIRWETLPEGDVGLRSPEGEIAEEHNLVALNDGSLYCTYRTVQGHNCHAYSRDGGRTWTPPQYATYTPDGRRFKHPRAANFVRKFSNGNYLFWFHNHGGNDYPDRNPAWLCGGVEKDGYIYWSEPEIALYDDDPAVRMSYPDFIEENGNYYVTETQKTIARVHKLDTAMLERMWNRPENGEIAKDGLVVRLSPEECGVGSSHSMPGLADLSKGGGFTVEFWIRFRDLTPGQAILQSDDDTGKGMNIMTTSHGSLKIILNDGRTECSWDCDNGILGTGRWHHVAVIVDGGPKLITFVVDGRLCDGGEQRQFGFGRIHPAFKSINGPDRFTLAATMHGEIRKFQLYNRYLLMNEAVDNYKAGM